VIVLDLVLVLESPMDTRVSEHEYDDEDEDDL
jgi:hypothetical protein